MKKWGKILFLLLVCFMVVIVVTGCGGEKKEEVKQEAGGNEIFIVARATDADTLDPGYGYSEGDTDPMYHMFEGLVKYTDDQLTIGPALAESWDVTDDGKTWTFNLRKGVKFHDGTDFNADAVVFSFKRLYDKNHPFYGLGAYSYFDYLLGAVVKEVKAVDQNTVQIELNNPFAPFLTFMGYYSEFIVSPTAVEKYGKEFFKNPVGTGPYKLEEWSKDEYIKITKNEEYWGEKPEIDQIIWKVVPDASTRLMELQTGQVHAIKNISPEQLETIKGDANIELLRKPGASLFYLVFNHEAKPLDDVRVRQALNYAVDIQKLVDNIYEGLGTRAVNIMPPTVFGYNNEIQPYTYDPEKAKQLLAEAGYPNGFDLKLNAFSGARPYIGRPVDAAEVIANDLRKVGINVNVVVNEWATHKSELDNFKHQAGLIGWFDVPDPYNFLNVMLMQGMRTKYAPERIKNLLNKAMSTYDKEEQAKYYKEVQQIVRDDAVVMPIAHTDYTAAVRKEFKGFRLNNIGSVLVHEVKK